MKISVQFRHAGNSFAMALPPGSTLGDVLHGGGFAVLRTILGFGSNFDVSVNGEKVCPLFVVRSAHDRRLESGDTVAFSHRPQNLA